MLVGLMFTNVAIVSPQIPGRNGGFQSHGVQIIQVMITLAFFCTETHGLRDPKILRNSQISINSINKKNIQKP